VDKVTFVCFSEVFYFCSFGPAFCSRSFTCSFVDLDLTLTRWTYIFCVLRWVATGLDGDQEPGQCHTGNAVFCICDRLRRELPLRGGTWLVLVGDVREQLQRHISEGDKTITHA